VTDWMARIRPNILIAMLIIGGLGLAVSILGYRMGMESIVAAASGIALTSVTALAMKVLEKD
jgi:hypothetical protein